MASIKLENMSIYFLIRELIYAGTAGIDNNLEPIEVNELTKQLIQKSGFNFGDEKKKWVDWFLSTSSGATQIEKDSIIMTVQIIEAENKYLPKINP